MEKMISSPSEPFLAIRVCQKCQKTKKHEKLQGGPKKTLLLSGFEFLTLGEVFLGVVFHQKLIGGGLTCPTCVLHV